MKSSSAFTETARPLREGILLGADVPAIAEELNRALKYVFYEWHVKPVSDVEISVSENGFVDVTADVDGFNKSVLNFHITEEILSEQFLDSLRLEGDEEDLNEAASEFIWRSREVGRMCAKEFLERAASGELSMQCRPERDIADVWDIPTDVAAQLGRINWAAGTAETANGTLLYHMYVVDNSVASGTREHNPRLMVNRLASLMIDIDPHDVIGMTPDRLFGKIEALWKQRFPSDKLPSPSTIRRAKDLYLKNNGL